MKKIKIIRDIYIEVLLKEIVEEFKKRDISITIDQAHCLEDLEYWYDQGSVENSVDSMLEKHIEIVEEDDEILEQQKNSLGE
jgi:hypothetical protein